MGKVLKGNVIKITKDGKKSHGGYTKYLVTLDTNEHFILSLGEDETVPENGQKIAAELSIGKVYVLLKIYDNMSSKKSKKEKSSKKGKISKKQKIKNTIANPSKPKSLTTAGSYWDAKYDYEVNIRDVAMRKQARFNLIAQFYVKPGETLANCPKRLNAALAKYAEVFGEPFNEFTADIQPPRTRRSKAEIEAEKAAKEVD